MPQIENEADVKAELEAQRLVLMKPLEKAMQEKADILSGTAISKKQAEAKVLESKLDVIRAEQREKIAAVRKPFDEQIAALEAEAKTAAETVKPYRQTVVNLDNAIRENEEKLKVLQDSWQAVDAEEFNDICPAATARTRRNRLQTSEQHLTEARPKDWKKLKPTATLCLIRTKKIRPSATLL